MALENVLAQLFVTVMEKTFGAVVADFFEKALTQLLVMAFDKMLVKFW